MRVFLFIDFPIFSFRKPITLFSFCSRFFIRFQLLSIAYYAVHKSFNEFFFHPNLDWSGF